jgi:predicted glycosyltransferase
VITGPRMARDLRDRIEALGAANGCRVVPFLADLPAWLHHAELAISQAGYNTVADLIAARCRSVLVPFADGGETEQTERAGRLDRRRIAIALTPADLSVDRLAAAIDAARALPPLPDDIALDGAYRTAEIVQDFIRRRSA